MSAEGAPRQFAKELTRALAAFARTARAKRLYQDNNAVMQRMMRDLNTTFRELLQKRGEISLRVRPDAFVFEEERVLEEPNPDESIPFAFYRDGIRRLDLSAGLSPAELEVLLEATQSGFSFSGFGDDIVSYLWQHELENVHYVVVDTAIVDAGPGAGASAADDDSAPMDVDAQIDGLLLAIYGQGNDDVGAKSVHVDASDIPAKSIADALEAVDEMAPGFHPVRALRGPPGYAAGITSEISLETEARLSLRALYDALDVFAKPLRNKDVELLSESLLDRFDSALVGGDLPSAAGIVSAVRGLGQIAGMAPGTEERVERWLDRAVVETRLRPIAPVHGHGANIPDLEAALSLLRACGFRAMRSALAILPGLSDPLQRRAFSDLVLELGLNGVAPLRSLLDSTEAYTAREAVYLASRMKGPEAEELFLSAKQHPDPIVRLAMLEYVDKSQPPLLLSVALDLVGDSDPRVAAGAADSLALVPGSKTAQEIESLVVHEAFLERPLEVKKALLASYARIMRSKALPLFGKFLKAAEVTLPKRGVEELAVAAVEALPLIGTSGATAALRKAHESPNRKVRSVVKALVDQLKENKGGD